MSETYADVETRISKATELLNGQKKLNFTATLQVFNILGQQLQIRWQGHQSKIERDRVSK